MFCYSIYFLFIFEIAFPCWVLFNTKRKVVMITLCCLRQFTQSLTKKNPKKRKDNDKCVANIELALSLRKFTRSLTQTRDLSRWIYLQSPISQSDHGIWSGCVIKGLDLFAREEISSLWDQQIHLWTISLRQGRYIFFLWVRQFYMYLCF